MKHLLEDLMARAAIWSEEAQAELFEAMIEIETKHAGEYRLNDAERQAVRRGLREMRDGAIASDEQVASVFNRYRQK